MRNMQDVFKSEREMWLDEARATARKLLMTRERITINDVLAEVGRPDHIHRNTTGSVFNHKDFKKCGYTRSTGKLANGRYVFQWKLAEESMPLTMRQIHRARQEAQ